MSRRYSKALPARWRGLAKVFTALGDEHRQRILLMLEHGDELTIKDIVDRVPLSRTAFSHHVRVLRESGVLRAEKRGREVYLIPNPKLVLDAVEGLRTYIREEFRS